MDFLLKFKYLEEVKTEKLKHGIDTIDVRTITGSLLLRKMTQ